MPDDSHFCRNCGKAFASGANESANGSARLRSWWWFGSLALMITLFSFAYRSAVTKPKMAANGHNMKHAEAEQEKVALPREDPAAKPFNINISRLDRNYEALDPNKLWIAINDREIQAFKHEYESTEEHRKRIQSLRDLPVEGDITLSSMMALPIQTFTPTFDADRNMMTVTVIVDAADDAVPTSVANRSQLRSVLLKGVGTQKPSYIGTNAFGAQVEVTSTDKDFHILLFPKALRFKIERYKGYGASELVFRVPAETTEAPELKERLRLLVVCHLREPYIDSWHSDSRKPTITNPQEEKETRYYFIGIPSEFWLYDFQSGRIVQRLRPDGHPAS